MLANEARRIASKEKSLCNDPTFVIIRDYIFEKIKYAALQGDYITDWRNDVYFVRHSMTSSTWSVPNDIYEALVKHFEEMGYGVTRCSGNCGLHITWYVKEC